MSARPTTAPGRVSVEPRQHINMREIKNRDIKLPVPTLWERALNVVAPKLAQDSYRTRCMFSMLGSYAGSSKTRRSMSDWSVTSGDADADTLGELDVLRQRSRDLMRSNSVANSVVNTQVTSIIGTGLKLQCRINAQVLGLTDEAKSEWEANTEAEFALFASRCDYEQLSNFAGLQELAFRSVLENGDCLCMSPYKMRTGDTYGLKIQLVEADRVCNDGNSPDTETLSGGVERRDGVPYRYHVMTQHPGSNVLNKQTWSKHDAYAKDGIRRNAWLLYTRNRIGQTRGVPNLAPVVEDLKQLGRYKEAELMAAVVSSLFTVFVKTADGKGLDLQDMYDETGGASTDSDIKLGPGMIVDLMADEDIALANPSRPNPAFEAFVTASTREIGSALQVPYELLTKHFSSSYSASRAALLEAWRFFLSRRKWLADNFCAIVYELFLTEAVAAGRIVAPGFLAGDPKVRAAWLSSEWVGDSAGHIDEAKAADAANKRIQYGLSSESIETTALTGRDWDTVYHQRKKEIERRKADGVLLTETNVVTEDIDDTDND